MPLLQAEEDRDQVRRHYADQARAKELLGDQDIKVYYSDRCVASFPQFRSQDVESSQERRFIKPTFGVTPSPGGPGDLTKSK